jgi:hypothetical protein
MAAFDGLFGTGEFSSRFPAALFGLLGVVGVFLVGRRLHGRQAGLLAALVLTTAPQWLRFSRQAMLDVPLSASIVFAMLGLIDSSWLLFGVSMGGLSFGSSGGAEFCACGTRARSWRRRCRSSFAGPRGPHRLRPRIVRGDGGFSDYYFGYSILDRPRAAKHGARHSYYLSRIFTDSESLVLVAPRPVAFTDGR